MPYMRFALPVLVCLPSVAAADALTPDGVAALFADAPIVAPASIVDCTLSGGADAQCIQFSVKPEPTTYVPGPWCPTNLADGPQDAGIWFYEGEAVDADGDFFAALADLYGDARWQMVDPETGDIKYTATAEECAAAARPDVGPEYENFCVQCLPEYVDPELVVTYSIPVEPVAADRAERTNQTGSGIAFNGIRLDGPAPVDAILGAYTVAPFDDCGGHINLHVGYHYHAATDCLTENHTHADPDAPTDQLIGLAMDGYFIAARALSDGSVPDDLDQCNGHTTDALGYHYHAGEEGSNAILGCLTAQAGCVAEGEGGTCDATARPPRP